MASRWVKSESLIENESAVSAKPGGPLRPRLEAVQRRIENQIKRLDEAGRNLKAKDDDTYNKLMTSVKENNLQYSTVLSADLSRSRQVSRVLAVAKLTLEKIYAKLASVSDFGDLVIVLSPTMAVVRNIKSLLAPHVPEMEEDLGVTSELLSGILVDAGQAGGYTINFETANEEAVRLIDETSQAVEQKMREEYSGIPDMSVISKVA
ncbi:MAG: hypothetical protein DA330_06760 [Nitrososphaera sp.]|nr:hypothetical protein [Nitrososphaera sp.]